VGISDFEGLPIKELPQALNNWMTSSLIELIQSYSPKTYALLQTNGDLWTALEKLPKALRPKPFHNQIPPKTIDLTEPSQFMNQHEEEQRVLRDQQARWRKEGEEIAKKYFPEPTSPNPQQKNPQQQYPITSLSLNETHGPVFWEPGEESTWASR
jgi:hypothetical protein